MVFEPIPALRPAHTIVPSTTPGLVYKNKGTIAVVDMAATSTGRIQGNPSVTNPRVVCRTQQVASTSILKADSLETWELEILQRSLEDSLRREGSFIRLTDQDGCCGR